MKVVLAGYNVDSNVIEKAIEAGVEKDCLTPEVLSAAYARISRDPRSIGELRKEAAAEVDKARKSNRTIVFGMGHHSVAEHAVFNFDIIGISRLAIEELEHFRLCSFTEKSQRYITLDHDFNLPEEFQESKFEKPICDLVIQQAELYSEFHQILKQRLETQFPEKTKKRAGRNLLDGLAKEDARYITILATTGQLGFTTNARNLELVIRRLAASPLAEVRALGDALYQKGREIAPSLLLFTEPAAFDKQTLFDFKVAANNILDNLPPAQNVPDNSVSILEHTQNPDDVILATLLAKTSTSSYIDCKAAVQKLNTHQKQNLFETTLQNMEFFDAPLREFEHVTVTMELAVSAACFGQLKRHRMASLSVGPYDCSLGVTIPPAIIACGLQEKFTQFCDAAQQLYNQLAEERPDAAPYVLTNAHRRKVIMTANLRDLYHFIRLREDEHAQWDIRQLATEMKTKIKEIMPLGALLLCGKDRFVALYEQQFGKKPKLDPSNL